MRDFLFGTSNSIYLRFLFNFLRCTEIYTRKQDDEFYSLYVFFRIKKLNKEYENNLCNGYHHLTVVMALPSVFTSLNPIPFAV